jgi:hypothetical protein
MGAMLTRWWEGKREGGEREKGERERGGGGGERGRVGGRGQSKKKGVEERKCGKIKKKRKGREETAGEILPPSLPPSLPTYLLAFPCSQLLSSLFI